MVDWLSLSDEDRLISIQQAAANAGVSTKVIEKDWWVTSVLKALFQSEFSPYLSFKGGTSLSKGWNLSEPFPVATVEPKRTFLEKIFLLHEEFLRPVDRILYERMSRHLYDLERMMDTEHAEAALRDPAYYEAIVEHRRHLIFKVGVDYDTHQRPTLNFIPREGILKAFEADYALMCEQMIYDEQSKDFVEIITRLTSLLERIKHPVS